MSPWHVVTTDSTTVYTWPTEEEARDFARGIGFIADYHEAGSEDCNTWGCKQINAHIGTTDPNA